MQIAIHVINDIPPTKMMNEIDFLLQQQHMPAQHLQQQQHVDICPVMIMKIHIIINNEPVAKGKRSVAIGVNPKS